MEFDPKDLETLYRYFGQPNRWASESEFLLACNALSKDVTCGDILQRFLEKSPPPSVPWLKRLRKIVQFFIRNAGWLLLHVIKRVLFGFSGQRFSAAPGTDFLILIDVYFFPRKIVDANQFTDSYFPRLEEEVRATGHAYAFVPKWMDIKDLPAFYRALKILKRDKVPVWSEFQLLTLADYVSLVKFLFVFPLEVSKLSRALGPSDLDRLFRHALWDSLDRVQVSNHLRFLYGKRLAGSAPLSMQCISWFENQPLDKCFYKGLRSGTGKVRIYGCQTFVFPPTLVSYPPDPTETGYGWVPDVVLTNGPYYLKESGEILYRVGPSLRYHELYRMSANPAAGSVILVLFPYWKKIIEYTLPFLRHLPDRYKIVVKFHPATSVKQYQDQLPEGTTLTDESVYSQFASVRMVVGSSSGALVEAATLGIPVIHIDHPQHLIYNYLPDLGRGILWDQATSPEKLAQLIEKFDKMLESEGQVLRQTADKLKESLFCEPTPRKIREAFDLDSQMPITSSP